MPTAPGASFVTSGRPTQVRLALPLAFVACGVIGACAARPPPPHVAAPSPSSSASTLAAAAKEDHRGPKSSHADAIGRLLDAPWAARVDKRRVVSLPLPDGPAWTHVKFWGVTTLAGYRYGDDHHAVAAVFTFAPSKTPATADGCAARFESWGRDHAKNFDILVGDSRVDTFAWGNGEHAKVYVLDAERRSLFGNKKYAAAYAVYPAWTDACLVVGVAAPEDEAGDAARMLRDRLVRDALPGLVAKEKAGAVALEAKVEVD